MRCPLCDFDAPRADVHAHLVEEHPDHVRTWMEPETGRMRYEVACPECGEAHTQRVKPRSSDPGFLEVFAGEIRLVAFDMLLLHMEAEHGGAGGGADVARDRSDLPAAGPGGGRGRPGDGVVPLPPGMPAPTPGPLHRRGGVDVKTWKPTEEEDR